ncbi:MAG: proline--tRNA ligase, partial [Gammaproteobacteria bacterium]
REFIMKDAYSFDLGLDEHQSTYRAMHDAYTRIFERTGLDFRVVEADSGAIGGAESHEFHVLAESGEDAIAFSSESSFAANVELIACAPPACERAQPTQEMAVVDTPDQHTIAALASFLNVPAERCLKTLMVESADGGVVALCLRGDHDLNAVKTGHLAQVASPLTFASPVSVKEATGSTPGSVGPVGLKLTVIADRSAIVMSDFVCGANANDKHLTGVNWGRDLPEPEVADLRNALPGDASPDGHGTLSIARGIEVGHIFQLGTKYSEALNAVVLDERGKAVPLFMGCYGIGVTRVVAAAIEQNHDDKGIVWPTAIAPFQVALLPMNMHKSHRLRDAVDAVYEAMQAAGIEVLLDDRNVRPGVMFAENELIGIPYRLTLGERGLDAGTIEFRHRSDDESIEMPLDDIVSTMKRRIDKDVAGE